MTSSFAPIRPLCRAPAAWPVSWRGRPAARRRVWWWWRFFARLRPPVASRRAGPIAFHAYRRILLDRLHALYVGEAYSDEFRRIKLGDPVVAQVARSNQLIGPTLDGVPLDIRYRYSPATRGRNFAGDADMAHFALWLPLALAERERIRADLEPAPQVWRPARKLTPELIMAYDADQLPYEEWRALYLQEQ